MTAALILLCGVVYIVLSIVFRFTPRLRVMLGLVVGALLAGVVVRSISGWLATAIGWVAEPLGQLVGRSTGSIATAIPSAIALGLAIVVVVFLRRGKGGGGAGAGGKGGLSKGGGGGGKAGLAHAALACALLLPIILGSLGATIRSVVQ
jgi:hypothetical protein